MDAYQNAIRLGYRQLAVYEPLVALLNQLGRYAEAESCLAGLQGQLPGSAFLSSVEISHAAERGQWQQAIELARRTAEAQPNNPQAAVWLSRLLETDNQAEAAGEVLEKAAHSNPQESRRTLSVAGILCAERQNGTGKGSTWRNLRKTRELPQADRTLLLAQGYELVRDDAQAKENWKTRKRQTKDTPAEQTTLAKQLLDRDPQAAEKALRRALQLDANYCRRAFHVGQALGQSRRRSRVE